MITIHVEKQATELLMSYLLLADPDKKVVSDYLTDGTLFSIRKDDKIVGVIVVVQEGTNKIEIKNLAVDPRYQGQGVATTAIRLVEKWAFERGNSTITVGTDNSSLQNIEFYHNRGFEDVFVKRGFFLKYDLPIYENGIRATDLLMFEKKLGE
ncbi:GNAT family N-acetyltransferase [Lentilactobacillus sp. Marseille-Q4993]|uniref:GNAT family N-acetyltransferase n=1 Tax=Lentilactobacillus sp. Marseille-Q4993 TaxID=3039492 RepID=UPI0024BC9196|nr:GNAT family N-acetyltransferase [Lentilactobacillus sp. Marseille-Q4993]